MEWTIKLMYAILLTSITGSICFGVWYGIGHILEKKGFLKIMDSLLRIFLIWWCLPLAFIVMAYKDNQIHEGGGWLLRICCNWVKLRDTR